MRLIDADKLRHVIHCAYSDDLEILEKIDEQPTTYDVEKVIERLKELPKYSTWNHNSDNVSRKKVIDIIKGGGVE